MIEVDNLNKHYGTVRAVRGLSLSVERGQVIGFLGPNGAGKSTTLRILAGFLGATSGSVRIAGFDIERERLKAMAHIGYMPESSPLYPEMRVHEYLRFRAELKGVARRQRSKEVERVLAVGKVSDMADVVIDHLSKGYRQRVGLADALLGSPSLLILDEPSAGLDPNQIQEVRALIKTLAQQHTIVLSTHILSEVEATCDRAVVIAKGRLLATGSIDELRQRRAPRLQLLVRCGDPQRLQDALSAVADVSQCKPIEHDENDLSLTRFEIALEGGADAGALAERVAAEVSSQSGGLRELIPIMPSLEEIFVDLTRQKGPTVEAELPAANTEYGSKKKNKKVNKKKKKVKT